LEIDEGRSAAWRLMAQPLLALGRHEEAGRALDRFIATVPVAEGKPPAPEQAGALAGGLEGRGLGPDRRAKALRARGLLHQTRGDQRSALDCYTQGLRLARDPETLALRGWTYLSYDAPELALADFDEAARLRPGWADALIGRANVRVRLGQTREALEDVERGAAGAADARMLYNAARVHAQAVAALRDAPKKQAEAERCERRAAELLRQALERTPVQQRPAFWKDHVQADRAFDPVRRGGAMSALAARYEK